MKKDMILTFGLLGLALVILVAANVTKPKAFDASAFDDQNEAFYKNFDDPLKAEKLEIVRYDEQNGVYKLSVELINGRWRIPSHGDYPADAKDKMAKFANNLIGIKKDINRADNSDAHADLGLIDPEDDKFISKRSDDDKKSGSAERGVKVIMKDKNDNILASYVIGNSVDGMNGFKFIRIPEKDRSYAAKINLDLSTQFTDWISNELLEVTSGDIVNLDFNKYKIERNGIQYNKTDGEVLSVSKDNDKWVSKQLPKGKNLKESLVTDANNTISNLKIIGVRKKPEILRKLFTGELKKLDQSTAQAVTKGLMDQGFYLDMQKGTLFGQEGSFNFESSEGLQYTFYLGARFHGHGLELTSGEKSEKPKDKVSHAGHGDNHRYVLLTIVAKPELIKVPVKVVVPEEPKMLSAEDLKKEAVKKIYDAAKASYDEAKAKAATYETEMKDYEEKKKKASEKATRLQMRYANWFYVVSATDFSRIVLDDMTLFEVPKPEKAPTPPGGAPGLPQIPGLIPQLPK